MAVRRLCSTHARSMPLQPGQHMNRTIACTDRSTQLHANRTELRPISRRECSSPYRVPYESILSAIICCYFYFPIIVTASHYQSSKLQYMRALNSYSDDRSSWPHLLRRPIIDGVRRVPNAPSMSKHSSHTYGQRLTDYVGDDRRTRP